MVQEAVPPTCGTLSRKPRHEGEARKSLCGRTPGTVVAEAPNVPETCDADIDNVLLKLALLFVGEAPAFQHPRAKVFDNDV
jgi:hypothetical protein